MNLTWLSIPKTLDEEVIFKKMIRFSIALHIAAFLFFGVKAAFFQTESINLDAAIKVDMVGLPDKMAQLPEHQEVKPEKPAPKTAPPEPPKPVVKKVEMPAKPLPKPVVVLHPTKANTEKALEKIRRLEKEERRKRALQEIQNEVSAEESRVNRQQKVAQLLKGNAVSPGTALHGLVKSEFNEYIASIQSTLHQHWSLPEFLKNDNLRATVVIYLDGQGNVVKRVISKSSGDERFDALALRTVDESTPFSKPPEKFVDLVRVDGFTVGFPE